jgi:acetylglutamate kinase
VGVNPVVVHGGGPMINEMLAKLGITSTFVNGKRVTDAATVEVVEMVLSGRVNKRIVQAINAEGGKAVGLSGKDAGLITCDPADPELGFVGEPTEVNPAVLMNLFGDDMIPVIAPLGAGRNGETYNINGDTAAGAIAAALKADRLLLLTDVAGVKNAEGEVVTALSAAEVEEMTARRDRGRHDPQDRNRAFRRPERCARLHHRRRARAERGSAGVVHRPRRGLDDPCLTAGDAPDYATSPTAVAREQARDLRRFHPRRDGTPKGRGRSSCSDRRSPASGGISPPLTRPDAGCRSRSTAGHAA